ncbi:hypothetical protein Tco_1250361 [Tanacetum coccineum]
MGNFSPQISAILANFEKFHSCLKEEMVDDLRYFNSLEHEVDSLKSQLETQKTQFLNEIDRLSREYYYADHMNAILGVYTKFDEVTNLQCDCMEVVEKCQCLEKELSNRSKNVNNKSFNELSKRFYALEQHSINLELALQQSQLQDKGIAISELKKLIEKLKGKYVETKFEKSSVIRQPNAFKSQRQSILGKPAMFSDSLAKKDFSKLVNAQILSQNVKSVVKNTNVIAPGMYNVSRPQLKSNQLEDRVLPNNSEVKTKAVQEHHRNFKFSMNKMSVTTCNDSLNVKTSNVNFVCVTCGKCLLNDNHDLCVLYYINGVNSRTRMPIVVPISTREPKRTVNQSASTPLKRIVATKSTNQKPSSIIRKQYEQINKTCKWWYCKLTPSGYKWKPKSSIGNVNTNLSMPLGNASRTANILEPMTLRKSTISNTPSSFNSFAAHRDNSVHRQLWVLKAYDGKSQASKYTWTHFLRSKDEIPEVLIRFLRLVQRGLHA